MLAPAPAPDWTSTVCLAAASFLTVSGVAATRVSPGRVSAGTPICMNAFPCFCSRRRIRAGKTKRDDTTGNSPALGPGEERGRAAAPCAQGPEIPGIIARRRAHSLRVLLDEHCMFVGEHTE